MGLDCSHDAFHGAYSAFNSFRQAVAYAVGGSYPSHYRRDEKGNLLRQGPNQRLVINEELDPDHFYTGEKYTEESSPGIFEFLKHSDCDGEIEPAMCKTIADELELLKGKMPEESFGHILRDGGYEAVLQRFIDGCRAAHEEDEPLRFR